MKLCFERYVLSVEEIGGGKCGLLNGSGDWDLVRHWLIELRDLDLDHLYICRFT